MSFGPPKRDPSLKGTQKTLKKKPFGEGTIDAYGTAGFAEGTQEADANELSHASEVGAGGDFIAKLFERVQLAEEQISKLELQ